MADEEFMVRLFVLAQSESNADRWVTFRDLCAARFRTLDKFIAHTAAIKSAISQALTTNQLQAFELDEEGYCVLAEAEKPTALQLRAIAHAFVDKKFDDVCRSFDGVAPAVKPVLEAARFPTKYHGVELLADNFPLDKDTCSRVLVVADSAGGKSTLLRQLLAVLFHRGEEFDIFLFGPGDSEHLQAQYPYLPPGNVKSYSDAGLTNLFEEQQRRVRHGLLRPLVVIVEDAVSCCITTKTAATLVDMYVRGRHFAISPILITQKVNSVVPTAIRSNLTHLIMKGSTTVAAEVAKHIRNAPGVPQKTFATWLTDKTKARGAFAVDFNLLSGVQGLELVTTFDDRESGVNPVETAMAARDPYFPDVTRPYRAGGAGVCAASPDKLTIAPYGLLAPVHGGAGVDAIVPAVAVLLDEVVANCLLMLNSELSRCFGAEKAREFFARVHCAGCGVMESVLSFLPDTQLTDAVECAIYVYACECADVLSEIPRLYCVSQMQKPLAVLFPADVLSKLFHLREVNTNSWIIIVSGLVQPYVWLCYNWPSSETGLVVTTCDIADLADDREL